MLSRIGKALKRNVPSLHGIIKRSFLWARIPVPKMINGKLVLVAPELFRAESTEPHIHEWIGETLGAGDTFLDVGAHYGWMSMTACNSVGPNGKVIAFEPSSPLLKLLKYNKTVNRLRQLEVVGKAVSEVPGNAVPFFLTDDGDSYLNTLVQSVAARHSLESKTQSIARIETTTLDEYCTENQLYPKVIKIDVEGAELLVLRGAQTVLSECHPTLLLAIHPTWLPAGQHIDELFGLLSNLGYRTIDSNVVRYEGADFGDYLFVFEAKLSFPLALREQN